ncbi:MAG: amidohydrolase family protein [Acidimicrobiales bacterium]|jgi:N-acyl-D-amino-acid deacylase|nr:amidohydrolase family protein [Acidimicrobiales bacterium]
MTDLVIRNARLVDGSGAPERPADVVVASGRVASVEAAGRASTAGAARVIDADGLLVTPGFVDVHTHYDAQVTWDPYLTPSTWHGVTTVVMGNCGVGFAPAAPDRHEWLIELMEGVEDIPGTALTEGITWGWTSFPEYLDIVEARSLMIDVGTQIAHGPLRGYVMGERGAANEPATAEDRELMAKLVAEALRAGALGFSTSRTSLHRSKSGELVPGTDADAEELMAIADAMAEVGHGVFQFAPEHARVPVDEWPWMKELARRTGRTVSINLNQPDSAPDVWREVLGLLDDAADEGLPIVAQVAGRSIGILYCLQGSVHPLLFHPAYAEVAHLPIDERLVALADPERRRRLIEDLPDDDGFFQRVVLDKLDRMWVVEGADIDYEPEASTSIGATARARGVAPMALLVDQLTSAEGNGMVYAPFFNYSYGDLSMSYEAHRHPGTRMGLSDAGAHCGAICDGGMPTFMLTHWVRDRRRGPRLPLEHVVHRQTRQTAELYGLGDRGLVAPGLRADLNVIDLDRLGFDVPRMAFDLPAGGRRLVQRGRGYVASFVAGVQTVDHDEPTGEMPGRLVRGPR